MEAGPALPSDEVEETIDDEEGRFFGGGITSDTADALNFIDERDKGDDAVWAIAAGKNVMLTYGSSRKPGR